MAKTSKKAPAKAALKKGKSAATQKSASGKAKAAMPKALARAGAKAPAKKLTNSAAKSVGGKKSGQKATVSKSAPKGNIAKKVTGKAIPAKSVKSSAKKPAARSVAKNAKPAAKPAVKSSAKGANRKALGKQTLTSGSKSGKSASMAKPASKPAKSASKSTPTKTKGGSASQKSKSPSRSSSTGSKIAVGVVAAGAAAAGVAAIGASRKNQGGSNGPSNSNNKFTAQAGARSMARPDVRRSNMSNTNTNERSNSGANDRPISPGGGVVQPATKSVPAMRLSVNDAEILATAKERYSSKDLTMFRTLIIEQRQEAKEEFEILSQNILDTSGEFEADNQAYSLHTAEQGSDAIEREKTFLHAQRTSDYIKKLDEALERIDRGTYGICIICGGLIEKQRLQAVPITQKHVDCKNRTQAKKLSVDQSFRDIEDNGSSGE